MSTVKELLDDKGRGIFTIHADASVFDAVALMNEKNIGALTITSASSPLAGIVSERDVARKVILGNLPLKETPVSDIMTSDVVFAREDTLIDRCMSLMYQKKIRHLPIVHDHDPTSMITLGDVMKTIIKEQSMTIDELESFIYEDRGGES